MSKKRTMKNLQHYLKFIGCASILIYIISSYLVFYFDFLFSLVPCFFFRDATIYYTAAELNLSDVVTVVPSKELLDWVEIVERKQSIYKQKYNPIESCIISIGAIFAGVAALAIATPPAIAVAFIFPAIAGAAAISATTVSGVLSEKSLLAISKMVGSPEIVYSVVETAQGVVLSVGTGDPVSTILMSSIALITTETFILSGVPTHIAAACGVISALMFHQISMLLIVNSFSSNSGFSIPVMMSGVVFTNLIGGSIAYYATIGGNLILQNIFFENVVI